MTYKDMIALFVFLFAMFALMLVGAYIFNQPKTCESAVIELPESVRINPDLVGE